MNCLCRFCKQISEAVDDYGVFCCNNCDYQFYYNKNTNQIEEEFFEFKNNISCHIFYNNFKFMTLCQNEECYHIDLQNKNINVETKFDIESYILNQLKFRENLKILH